MAQAATAETRADYDAKIELAKAKVSAAQTKLTEAEGLLTAAQALQSETNLALLQAQELLNKKNLSVAEKLEALQTAKNAVDQAQDNYNNNLISEPGWTPPTYQKENIRVITNTRIIEVKTLVPNITYVTKSGITAEVFDRRGFNNAPPLPTNNEVPVSTTTVSNINFQWGSGNILNSGRSEDVIVRFTGNLLFPESGNYRFYTPADDGTILYINGVAITNDWRDKGGGGTTSAPVQIQANVPTPFVLLYYENGGGAAVSFQYATSTASPMQVIPATHLGNTVEEIVTYEEVITYQEETYYTYETYYTTEYLLIEGKTEVSIDEGHAKTFTAPEGAVFITSNLRYEAKDRPECGTDIKPNLQGNQITIYANNGVWGDPCGGWYKHVVGTISYLGQPTAPLIKNPELLVLLEQTQSIYDTAIAQHNEAETELSNANVELISLQQKQIENQGKIEVALQGVTTEQEALRVAQQELQAIPPFREPTPTPEETEKPVEKPEEVEPEPLPEPEPPTTPEVSEPELPVDVSTVDPTTLSNEQVAELISVANEILNNSEQGSPEYEEALDALFVAAQADDIVLSEELAAIPGAEALVGAINFIGNVGSDMSPKVREKSEEVVVTAIVAVGAAVNAATGAAMIAAPASASSNIIRRNT